MEDHGCKCKHLTVLQISIPPLLATIVRSRIEGMELRLSLSKERRRHIRI
jgi:hypothetical protein